MLKQLSPRFHIRHGTPQPDILIQQLKHWGFDPVLTSNNVTFPSKTSLCPRQEGINFLSSLPEGEVGYTYRVACGRRLLEVPETRDEADRLLILLSGRRHQVWVGFGCKLDGKFWGMMIQSRVSFKRLTFQEQSEASATMLQDKAQGIYNPREWGARFIKSINGSPAVLGGLPAYEFFCFMQKCQIQNLASR